MKGHAVLQMLMRVMNHDMAQTSHLTGMNDNSVMCKSGMTAGTETISQGGEDKNVLEEVANMNYKSMLLTSVEHPSSNAGNESSDFGDAGSFVNTKVTEFPLSDNCPKWSLFSPEDEISFASTKDKKSTCSEENGFSRSRFLTEADSDHGPVKNTAARNVLCLDWDVPTREQEEAIKLRPSIATPLAQDNVRPENDLDAAGQNEVGPLKARETKKGCEQVLTALSEEMAAQSNIGLNAFGTGTTRKTSSDLPILELKKDGKVPSNDYVTDEQMPVRATEDAMHSAPGTKGVCDPLQKQINQKKTNLALLDSNCSSINETSFESKSSIKLQEGNGCELGNCTSSSSSSSHSAQDTPTLEFAKCSNLYKALGGHLVSEETKSLPLWTEESKGAQVATRQLNKVGPLVEIGRTGGANFSSQSFRDDVCSLSEMCHVDTEAAGCPSATLSGSIPYSGPISYSGPMSYSGLVSYSGQIPYSGSISLRSESSTTSTRSFAFPILASEWNNSPVKMPKPDRRYVRRRWRWRSCCICCRKPSTLFD